MPAEPPPGPQEASLSNLFGLVSELRHNPARKAARDRVLAAPADVLQAARNAYGDAEGLLGTKQAMDEAVALAYATGVAAGRTPLDPDHVLETIRRWVDDAGYSLLNRDVEDLAVRIVAGSTDNTPEDTDEQG